MDGESGPDVLPLPGLGGDASATQLLGPQDEVVEREQIFCFIEAAHYRVFVSTGMSLGDAEEPVANPATRQQSVAHDVVRPHEGA